MNNRELLRQSVEYSFLQSADTLDSRYAAKLLTNDAGKNEKVFLTLERELESCSEFALSVAFITQSGLQLFKPVLRQLQKKGIRGRILTTNYLAFTQPEALKTLLEFDNIELRMFVCENNEGFHTKGYFFSHPEEVCLIVGSSNLTDKALCLNQEFNLQVYSTYEGSLARSCLQEFDSLFHAMNSVDYRLYQETYEEQYRLKEKEEELLDLRKPTVLSPNTMQLQFIQRLKELISKGQSRALLVSATGTGKTYAAAFAVREFAPKRILFLVHREQIARKSMESFRRVIGNRRTYGVLSGTQKDYREDYLFSTVQTLSRKHIYSQFAPDHFDWIIIDEVHRAAADSYQRIFDYFKPKFWHGMSATPQRTDGKSIYELFDHNVACQITLKEALEEDLLCPFHYYALDDVNVSDQTALDPKDFNRLVEDERIRHILREADYYGWSGPRRKGLMFVSTLKEAEALSAKLNEKGLRTMALSGANSQEERERAIERLVQDEDDETALDYLITVDIFNEGVDIPEINQVILLRPTQSAIVFVQQLGRGLRKSPGKEFVTVLDFIGLYQNNFMIPQALSESRSGNKDTLRRFVQEGNSTLPGVSTVHFSEQAKSRIFKSIEQATMNSGAVLYDGWKALENQLGRVPRLIDFDRYHGLDPVLIFSNKSYQTYPEFLKKKCRIQVPELSELELNFLRFVCTQWANGKRPHELWLLDALIHHPDCWKEAFLKTLHDNGFDLKEKTWINLYNQFRQQWLKGGELAGWQKKNVRFLEDEKHLAKPFIQALKNPAFVDAMDEVIEFGINRWRHEYPNFYKNTWLNLDKMYTYTDSFRLMDFPQSKVSLNVGGYILDKEQKTFPVYINYDKAEDIAASIDYEDHFINPHSLLAFSKGRKNLNSSEIVALRQIEKEPLFIPLFVRKNTEVKDNLFYFLGEMKPDGLFKESTMKNGQSVVKIGYELEVPVRKDLYDYLVRS